MKKVCKTCLEQDQYTENCAIHQNMREKIDNILNEHVDFAEWAKDSYETTDALLAFLKEEIQRIIGQDEITQGDYGTDKYNYLQCKIRNKLRKEQRKRAE